MISIKKILMVTAVLLSSAPSFAQIKNSVTESVKIYGNCGMCESKIEKAGNLKKIANVDWNKDTKMAMLTYDPTKTNQDEILKRIALAGYDSEKFLAPDDVYANLSGCCKYDRELKTVAIVADNHHEGHDHEMHATMDDANQKKNELTATIANYFTLKDALVQTDSKATINAATALTANLKAIDMKKLSNEEHVVWMKVMKSLTSDAEKIADTKDIAAQRATFSSLSGNMYLLMKVTKHDAPVYLQNCPMYNNGKGGNWLSTNKAVKNPYYGSKMMSCGSTVETLN